MLPLLAVSAWLATGAVTADGWGKHGRIASSITSATTP